MRLGFKALASIAALVIGSFAYLLGSPLLAVACVLLSLFFSKEKLKAFYEQHAGALKSSASTASSNKSNIDTWDNKKNTPAKPSSAANSVFAVTVAGPVTPSTHADIAHSDY